jgi:hypothetical protein
MRNRILVFLLFSNLLTYAQEYKDTTFSVRGNTCSCKYNLNIEEDKNTYTRENDGIFSAAERAAYYPGGSNEWKKFLKKNLDKSFKGKDKVDVRFQVDKNGDLSRFEIMNRAPAQKFEEIVRVLKLSGKWFPLNRNGFCVNSYLTRTFEL